MKILFAIFFIASINIYADSIDDALKSHFKGNYQEAHKAYTQACNQENAKGCLGLGTLYALGHGVDRNIQTAQKYFQQACEGGNERGCFNYDLYKAKE